MSVYPSSSHFSLSTIVSLLTYCMVDMPNGESGAKASINIVVS